MSELDKVTMSSLTATNAINLIRTWSDLSPDRRRDLISALNTVSKAAGVPPELMILSPERLRGAVMTKSAAAWDVTIQRRTNALCLLRYVMRRLNLIEAKDAPLTPLWEDLAEKLDKHTRMSLIAFIRFCVVRDIPPVEVGDPVLCEFQTYLTSRTLSVVPRDIVTAARRAWNHTADSVPEWPNLKLNLNSQRDQLLLPFTEFMPSFQEAIVGFKERLAGQDEDTFFGRDHDEYSDDPFTQNADFKPNRPATVASKLQLLKVAANALYRSGHPLEEICTLENLINPPSRAEAILRQLLKNNQGKTSPNIAHVAELLRQIAKYHCLCPNEHIAKLAVWAKKLRTKKRKGITMRNRKLIGNVWTQARLGILYNLPKILISEATEADAGQRAVIAAQRAVMLEILTKFAPRLGTIINLRMMDHLIRPELKKGLITAIMIPDHETKNSRNLTYPVTEATAELLNLWITEFRPKISSSDNPYLFPGKDNGPMTLQGVRDSIKKITGERVGVALNPHIFRHLAAKTFLNAMPGAMDQVQQFLGHSLMSTSTRMYCDIEDHAATEIFDKILETARETLGVKNRKLKRRPKPKKSNRRES
jgi:hypothetical protein